MSSALIGYSGFVGQTLLRQRSFDDLYRSTNIQDIRGKSYDLVIGAGAPAKKWLANKDPEGDRLAIDILISHLSEVKARTFVLISTVDVFKKPVEVDEDTVIDTEKLHPYGFNRWRLEQFVHNHFPLSLIIRLPGLVGPGLKKNIIFDFKNNNNLAAINADDVFQFYPMTKLWDDIALCLENNLSLVHLTAETVTVKRVAQVFGIDFDNHLDRPSVRYDFRSKHAHIWGKNLYQYDAIQSLKAIEDYCQHEPRTL